jgi:uncharacterized membrane-anchored protein
MSEHPLLARAVRPGARRVPQITVLFWIIKALSTAMGEATSDTLVRVLHPVPAVSLGFLGLVAALWVQFSMRRYVAWTYWLAVVMVGVFGTMAADVLHVGFDVAYPVSSAFYALVLVAVFVGWQKTEKSLSIHSIDTPRREAFYWATVVATFALGTAVGDLTATSLHLGYLSSGLLFAGLIAVPALGFRWFKRNPVLCFWSAYVLTRPLGASFADWMGKSPSAGGLGWGDGTVAVALTILIFGLVAIVARTGGGLQESPAGNSVRGRGPARSETSRRATG